MIFPDPLEPPPCCPGCGNIIDPDCCWCGSPVENHGYHDNHSAVPMGCRCGFADQTMSTLRKDIQHAINCHSAESGSDTPDFILAEYLTDCLAAYDKAVVAREKWYGRQAGGVKDPCQIPGPVPETL
jgi:hypothetical protein